MGRSCRGWGGREGKKNRGTEGEEVRLRMRGREGGGSGGTGTKSRGERDGVGVGEQEEPFGRRHWVINLGERVGRDKQCFRARINTHISPARLVLVGGWDRGAGVPWTPFTYR